MEAALTRTLLQMPHYREEETAARKREGLPYSEDGSPICGRSRLGETGACPSSPGNLGKTPCVSYVTRGMPLERDAFLSPSQQNPKTKTPLLKQEESSQVEAET